MNEEEKKAIEDVNRFANGIDMSCVTARQMKIILNLIEKLQKELDRIKNLDVYKLVEDWETIQLVPIQTVKDMINEYTDRINKLHPASDIAEIEMLEDQIDVLEKIIEENKEVNYGV